MCCTILLLYHKSKCQLNGIAVLNQNKIYLSKTLQDRQLHMYLWLRSIFPAPDSMESGPFHLFFILPSALVSRVISSKH